MMTDPIADMLTRIRNAQKAEKLASPDFVYIKLPVKSLLLITV